MATITDILALEVDGEPAYKRDADGNLPLAFELADPPVKVYRVESDELGLSTQVRADDDDALQAIVDGHAEAVQQRDETRSETLLRWHRDPDSDFTIDDAHVRALEANARDERRALENAAAGAG